MRYFTFGIILAFPLVAWLWSSIGDSIVAVHDGFSPDAVSASVASNPVVQSASSAQTGIIAVLKAKFPKLFDWWRWAIWLFCATLHYWACSFPTTRLEEIKRKQPNSKGDFSPDYAKELKEKHATLGHLVNIGYTDFMVVKKSDLELRKWRYFFGFFLLFFVAYALFAEY